MTGFFRKRQDHGLEDRLRSLSVEPQDEFVRKLSTEIRASRVRNATRSRRVFAAVVTSGLILIPFAAFGGVGYAAQAAKSAAQSVVKSDSKGGENKGQGEGNGGNVAQDGNNGGDNGKPDDDQYKPGKGCGDKNHEHERKNECKKPPK